MTDLERNHREQVSRQKAAERLADLAFALTAGGSLELSVDGERLSVPLADDVLLTRDLRAAADRVELELLLSWSNRGEDDALSDGINDTRPAERNPFMSIVEQIKSAMSADRRIHHAEEIAVSERAGTVTLRGTVASLHQRRTAVEIARSVAGVAAVEDQLHVDPRDRVRDDRVRGAALQELMSDAGVPDERVDVSVSGGWVTLKGEVARQSESDAAFAAVSGLAGVGGITNEIKVVTAGIDG